MLYDEAIFDKKVSKSAIARILGVHRLTVAEFVKENLQEKPNTCLRQQNLLC